ncbi:MAG: DNA repair protein RadA [Candidatus Omnitrophica bacterium]|nr:DNA repair protein RadA [Candidatus Omnitrophota bacterium]
MYNCSDCGYKTIKWLGRCPSCEAWDTLIEEKKTSVTRISREKIAPKLLREIDEIACSRISTQLDELDRILGGGLVKGEIVLVGGEPGVGKSTLLLDVASKLSLAGKTLYVSAEESPSQIALRAKRLGVNQDSLFILGEDDLGEAANYIQDNDYEFVVIDSVQVVRAPGCDGPKGSVSQIRGCADYLTQLAKSLGIVVFLVGHVTKDGAIAGPKLLEHIVDCVLYFEGEISSGYRILRATKNRFGPTGNIAVFEMVSTGLRQVKKLNDIFLPHKDSALSGSCVVCAIEGLRPLLIEVQSLVTKASFGVVRRRTLGFDFNRFSLLIAIIEKRLKLSLSNQDVFLNVAGGLKISDPAVDLGMALAVISSAKEKQLPPSSVFIGEIGLAGELRRVNNINLRLKEIERADFSSCFIPESNLKEVDKKFKLKIRGFSSLGDIVKEVF